MLGTRVRLPPSAPDLEGCRGVMVTSLFCKEAMRVRLLPAAPKRRDWNGLLPLCDGSQASFVKRRRGFNSRLRLQTLDTGLETLDRNCCGVA